MRRVTRSTRYAILVVLIVTTVGWLAAASFAITRARWDSEHREVTIEGIGRSGAMVSVIDFSTGATIGTASVSSEGRWRVRRELTAVPCRVRAVSDGVWLEAAVEDAPASCTTVTTFLVTRLQWSVSERELSVEGTGRPGAGVVVTDADSNAPIGSATVASDGRWRMRRQLAASPCSVRATSDGTTLVQAVAGAPTGCSTPTATLSAVAIAGPITVTENGSASYVATATFSDGSTTTVTGTAAWSENSAFASIAGGTLSTSPVTGNQTVTVTASYTADGLTKIASLGVTILDVTVVGSHAGRFMTYEGTRTCLACHQTEAVALRSLLERELAPLRHGS